MSVSDPVTLLAELKLIKDSADLEAEIATKAPGWFIHVYRRLRRSAAEAMASMAFLDDDDRKLMREYQTRMRLFHAFVEEVKGFIGEGITADAHMTEQERQETLDILLQQGADGQSAAIELGLIDEPPGAGSG